MERLIKELIQLEKKRNSLLAEIGASLKEITNKENLSQKDCLDGIKQAVSSAIHGTDEEAQ